MPVRPQVYPALTATWLPVFAAGRRSSIFLEDTMGLRDAVEEMVRQCDVLHPKCRFEFRTTGTIVGLDSEIAISAYRLVQEALSNMVKRSGATGASVNMFYCANRKILCPMVKDNGKGFDLSAIELGIGRAGMWWERVEGLDGKLAIHTGPGERNENGYLATHSQ